jgi:hypothetical protein
MVIDKLSKQVSGPVGRFLSKPALLRVVDHENAADR